MAEEWAVELREVTKRFGDFTAVDRLSLQIEDGEFFSLLGPSGCGKTTTLRMIAGFEHPTSGVVRIGGVAQAHKPPYQRPVNTVFQNYALFPHMSVAENVAFGLQMQRLPREAIRQRVDDVLEMVRLPGFGHRRPKQLSGGQQQRVALARALINRPKVLLLDEPLGALDLKLRKAMQLELKALQAQLGLTFIYVTHDQEEALTMSDRIAVMQAGKVLQVGEPFDIYERPTSRFVADFIGETNFLEGKITGMANGTATVVVDGCLPIEVVGRSDLAVGQPVTIALRPEKMSVHAGAESASGTIPARISDVVYIGTDTRYTVHLTGQTTVTIREQNLTPGRRQLHRPGEEVSVSWAPDSVRILID